jgi:hypothetical protein
MKKPIEPEILELQGFEKWLANKPNKVEYIPNLIPTKIN